MLRGLARKYSKFRILARVYPGYELKVPTLVPIYYRYVLVLGLLTRNPGKPERVFEI